MNEVGLADVADDKRSPAVDPLEVWEEREGKDDSAYTRCGKRIVEQAKASRFGIAMENLKRIRNLCRKGDGQGTSYRGMMNSWTFGEFQRKVE
jgi:hypothetical protein